MKLKILSILLLTGSVIASVNPAGVFDDTVIEIQSYCVKNAVEKNKEKICKFIKKYKYEIAVAATALIGVGSAAYCYYRSHT